MAGAGGAADLDQIGFQRELVCIVDGLGESSHVQNGLDYEYRDTFSAYIDLAASVSTRRYRASSALSGL